MRHINVEGAWRFCPEVVAISFLYMTPNDDFNIWLNLQGIIGQVAVVADNDYTRCVRGPERDISLTLVVEILIVS